MIRNLVQIDDDISRKKRVIEQMLYEDSDIIEVLGNKYADCHDEAMYTQIFPFIRVPGTQDEAQSYICFAIDDNNISYGNSIMKDQYVKFVVFVHKDLVKTKYNIPRHDLLAFLIRDVFHLSNNLGLQCELVSNREGVTDEQYYTRTLQFKITTPNNIKPYQTNPYERESIVNNHDRKVRHESV